MFVSCPNEKRKATVRQRSEQTARNRWTFTHRGDFSFLFPLPSPRLRYTYTHKLRRAYLRPKTTRPLCTAFFLCLGKGQDKKHASSAVQTKRPLPFLLPRIRSTKCANMSETNNSGIVLSWGGGEIDQGEAGERYHSTDMLRRFTKGGWYINLPVTQVPDQSTPIFPKTPNKPKHYIVCQNIPLETAHQKR